MKKAILLLTLLTFSLQSFAPIKANWLQYDPYIGKVYKKHCLINNNLVKLRDGNKKSRVEVFKLIQPLLDVYLDEYRDNYVIKDSLSYALACLFVTETSTRKGYSGINSLWLKHYNFFGATARKGISLLSWEEINDKRVPMYRNFKHFDSFEKAIHSLFWDYLFNDRYDRLRTAKTVKDFLYLLPKTGFCTDSNYGNFTYNQIYLKSL